MISIITITQGRSLHPSVGRGEAIQARVQEFVRGGAQNLKAFFFFFFFAFQFFRRGGGPAPKIAEKKIFSTKKVAKYR